MKRLVCVAAAMLLMLTTLAGCTAGKAGAGGIYEKGKLVAEMGMEKEQVEKNLGEADESDAGLYLYGEDVVIGYKDSKVVFMKVYGTYSDSNQLSVGSSVEEIKKKYKESEMKESESAITIRWDAEGKVMEPSDEIVLKKGEMDLTYELEEGKIESFSYTNSAAQLGEFDK